LESIRIKGFRSLADIEIHNLPAATVLIGANGSGKSNLIRFFDLLSWMLRARRLGSFVTSHGGADDQLFRGSSVTPRMEATLTMRTSGGRNEYRFALAHAQPDRLMFVDEAFRFTSASIHDTGRDWFLLGSGDTEAKLLETGQSGGPGSHTARVITALLRSCAVYQFHDTSTHSHFKKWWDSEDSAQLRSHGGNLAAVLLRLEREDIRRYEMICYHISRVLPDFDRFELDESNGRVLLRWKARSTEKTFGAHLTSDGSLRLFALVTLLNLPSHMLPDVVLLDEPELGLHPAAISLIAGMVKQRSVDRQVIVATQSARFVDSFDLGEIIVLEIRDGRTECRRLDAPEFQRWIDEFSPGQLWEKNLLGGRP
jgi:predicted ATPase